MGPNLPSICYAKHAMSCVRLACPFWVGYIRLRRHLRALCICAQAMALACVALHVANRREHTSSRKA